MYPKEDTICAIATAEGDGAIGIVRISGENAFSLLNKVCNRTEFVPRCFYVELIYEPKTKQIIDQAMVCYMPGPNSYTGEDVVEVHGHGGIFNMHRLLELFLSKGARLAEPGEFTRRAFLNGRLDLTQAEAVAEVIAARSERALKNAQRLLKGDIGKYIVELKKCAIELVADLEAYIDFSDEIDVKQDWGEIEKKQKELLTKIETLAATYERGKRLKGILVALTGEGNVGKSSLLNALVGEQRALVSSEEGTTRDYLEKEIVWEGVLVTLVDTAGERAEMSDIERLGLQLAACKIKNADLVVRVVDLTRLRDSKKFFEIGSGEKEQLFLVAANKRDLLTDAEVGNFCAEIKEYGYEVVATSALMGEGIKELSDKILQMVLGKNEEPKISTEFETVQITQKRQWECLKKAGHCVEEGISALQKVKAPELIVEHLKEALNCFGEITGETFSEEVLDFVFHRFCIGK